MKFAGTPTASEINGESMLEPISRVSIFQVD